ncbi:MAG: hypothetical protein V1489_00750 [Candidatus Liptonbacteria bacterium]
MANNFANTQGLVALEDIKEGTLILKDGALRQIVMVGGVNFSLKSDDEQNMLAQAYQNFLNSLNFPVQILIHSRKINIEKYLEMLEGRLSQETSPLLQNQIAEYKEFIKNFVQQNEIMMKTFFVAVPFAPVSMPTKKSLLSFLPFGKKGDTQKDRDEKNTLFKEHLGQLKQRTAQIVDGLTGIGLEAVVLADEALVELVYNFYNPGTVEEKAVTLKH